MNETLKHDVMHLSNSSLYKYIFDTAIIIYYIHYSSSSHNSSMDKVMLHLSYYTHEMYINLFVIAQNI